MGTRLVAGLAALLLTAAAAGCGSSDEDKGPTKAQFIRRADALCKKEKDGLNDKAKQTFASTPNPAPQAIAAFFAQEGVPAVRREVSGLERLEVPKDDEKKVHAITDAANEALGKVEANPALAIKDGGASPFAKPDKLARAYGMKECGSS